MTVKVLEGVQAADEVVSTALVKAAAVIDADLVVDDDLISGLYVPAAREELEQLLRRSIGRQTLQLSLDAFPADGAAIKLPRPPVSQLQSVSYVDQDGVTRTLAPAAMYIDVSSDTGAHWLLPAFDTDWPATRDGLANAVVITYIAGYSAEDCPRVVRAWIVARAASLYRFREADAEKPPLPVGFVSRLVDRYRIYEDEAL